MRLLLLDNYDSFTYNLVELIRSLRGPVCEVVPHDRFDPASLPDYSKVLISPGPGLPSGAGLSCELIRRLGPEQSLLGICLGHQAIATVFGAGLYRMERVFHGKVTEVSVLDKDEVLFRNLPHAFNAGLYHSWAVEAASLPSCLIPTAVSGEGVLMGLRHSSRDIHGLQFHPESVMTPTGRQILTNWIHSGPEMKY
ncbi:MAG TPA: aminodeoxychorismate/anthranilate synthase component II [Bacteroidales bacterium]|nr:aminodeoxychorismate/anthranilate synthase component II [Bacteroidales bacterium]HSA42395.1 aminodeoxychorismate/anthranilate synthase component II [Bacteroidales bacterium]